ncbi:MAG TPA: hypothetical protein DIT87_01260, partial [Clostridiales bacterium]|nr:hypothetical protein [Clostridiales bacterium]
MQTERQRLIAFDRVSFRIRACDERILRFRDRHLRHFMPLDLRAAFSGLFRLRDLHGFGRAAVIGHSGASGLDGEGIRIFQSGGHIPRLDRRIAQRCPDVGSSYGGITAR